MSTPASIITKVAQLGKFHKGMFNGNTVYVGYVEQNGSIEFTYKHRDVTGMGDWEEVKTAPEWDDEMKLEILEALQ